MGREIRKVAAGWQHPKNEKGDYIPLFDCSFSAQLQEWNEGKAQWEIGYRDDFNGGWKPKGADMKNLSWEEWDGEMPRPEQFMPEWPEAEKTHVQLYETTTEGTPISPVFKADEFDGLCEWAAQNATVFAGHKASAADWKKMLIAGLVYHQVGNIIFT